MNKIYLLITISLLTISIKAQQITLTVNNGNDYLCTSTIQNGIWDLVQDDTYIDSNTQLEVNVKDWFSSVTIAPEIAENANAIRFDVKGDGSTYFASLLLGTGGPLSGWYETSFPLNNTDWVTHTIYLKDIVQFDKPWGVQNKLNLETLEIDKNVINRVGFGRMYAFHKYYTTGIGFSVRNIEFIDAGVIVHPEHKEKLVKTKELLEDSQPIKIMLLGDSISDHPGENNQVSKAFEKLKLIYGSNIEVANCAVAGHTSRSADIILDRSFLQMPNPDLVFLMFGANDCKATEFEGAGFNEDVFKAHLEHLINRIHRKTNGDVEIFLLSGVPRLEENDRSKSTGLVEKIAGAYPRIAEEYNLAYLNTIPFFTGLSAGDITNYMADTVHLTQAGTDYLGDLIYDHIVAEMNTVGKFSFDNNLEGWNKSNNDITSIQVDLTSKEQITQLEALSNGVSDMVFELSTQDLPTPSSVDNYYLHLLFRGDASLNQIETSINGSFVAAPVSVTTSLTGSFNEAIIEQSDQY